MPLEATPQRDTVAHGLPKDGMRRLEILHLATLRGPNVWSRRSVIEAWVDLGSLKDSPSNALPGLTARLEAWLPGLIEHRCGLGVRGGFLTRLRDLIWELRKQ